MVDKQTTIDAVETSIDVVEDKLDSLLVGNNKFVPWIKRGPAAFGLVSGVALCTGAGISYFFTKKRFKAKYEKITEKEIAEAKKFYGKLHKTDKDVSTPVAALEKYVGEVDALGYRSPLDGPQIEEPETRLDTIEDKVVEVVNETVQDAVLEIKNVFDDAHPVNDFNYQEELLNRDPSLPFIISQEEFFENEPEHAQSTLTYFEGDDVLTDEQDQPINETNMTVWDDNLLNFGHGSRDNNIVYIRNMKLGLDFEVLRSKGHYTKEVLGFIQHENRPRIRKFRSGDG